MKLFAPKGTTPLRKLPIGGKSIVAGLTPKFVRDAEADAEVLVDTEHDNGALYIVKVNVNEGFIEETCRVHAGYPGLACNRAWKLVNAKHKRRLGRRNKQTVVFTTEVA